MARKAKNFAWSYSALTNFETCPQQYYRVRVKKDIAEKQNAAMLEGHRVHKALEVAVGKGKPLPADLRKYQFIVDRFRNPPPGTRVATEDRYALNARLEPTGYYDKDVWVRIVIDLAAIAGEVGKLYDYKTGKHKPDTDQLKLFAAAGFSIFEDVQRFDTQFLWLKAGKVDTETFYRADASDLWADFEPRVEHMRKAFEDDYWPENPSGLCRGWCPVVDCPFWEPKRSS